MMEEVEEVEEVVVQEEEEEQQQEGVFLRRTIRTALFDVTNNQVSSFYNILIC